MIGNTYINQSRGQSLRFDQPSNYHMGVQQQTRQQARLLFLTEDFPQAGGVGIHDVTDDARFPGPTVSW